MKNGDDSVTRSSTDLIKTQAKILTCNPVLCWKRLHTLFNLCAILYQTGIIFSFKKCDVKLAFTEASEEVFKRKVLSSQFIFVSFFFHKRWDKWVGARVTETDHLYKSFPFNITYCNHSVFTNTCFCLSDILTTWFEKHLLCSSSFSLKQFTKTKAL